MKRSFTREKKKKSFFVPLCPRFVFSFLSFVLSLSTSRHVSLFLLFSKAPKWREKSQKDWDSHSDFSFVHLLQENASGDEIEDYVFLLFNCAWPEEDVVPWEPGCMHAWGAREGGLLALTGLSKQDKKRVFFFFFDKPVVLNQWLCCCHNVSNVLFLYYVSCLV